MAKITGIAGECFNRSILLSDRFDTTVQEEVDRFKTWLVGIIDQLVWTDVKLGWPALDFIGIGDIIIIDDWI